MIGKRFYTKTQLAQMFNICKKTLMKKIRSNQKLMKELEATGYTKLQKIFSPRQVRLIERYLYEE